MDTDEDTLTVTMPMTLLLRTMTTTMTAMKMSAATIVTMKKLLTLGFEHRSQDDATSFRYHATTPQRSVLASLLHVVQEARRHPTIRSGKQKGMNLYEGMSCGTAMTRCHPTQPMRRVHAVKAYILRCCACLTHEISQSLSGSEPQYTNR